MNPPNMPYVYAYRLPNGQVAYACYDRRNTACGSSAQENVIKCCRLR